MGGEGRGAMGTMMSDCAAFIMSISATPITHLISKSAESTWGDGNVTLLHFKIR